MSSRRYDWCSQNVPCWRKTCVWSAGLLIKFNLKNPSWQGAAILKIEKLRYLMMQKKCGYAPVHDSLIVQEFHPVFFCLWQRKCLLFGSQRTKQLVCFRRVVDFTYFTLWLVMHGELTPFLLHLSIAMIDWGMTVIFMPPPHILWAVAAQFFALFIHLCTCMHPGRGILRLACRRLVVFCFYLSVTHAINIGLDCRLRTCCTKDYGCSIIAKYRWGGKCCPFWLVSHYIFKKYRMGTQSLWIDSIKLFFIYLLVLCVPSVLWRCWWGGRKGVRPVKKWVVGCWYGYLSGARCRLAYGPVDATATHCLLLQ